MLILYTNCVVVQLCIVHILELSLEHIPHKINGNRYKFEGMWCYTHMVKVVSLLKIITMAADWEATRAFISFYTN